MTNFGKNLFLVIIAIIMAIIAFVFYSYTKNTEKQNALINNFSECAEAGFPVMESYPRQCKTPDGKNFIEKTGSESPDKSNLIVVDEPKPKTEIESPLTVKGKARGNWFFEASFPIELIVDGRVIASGIAEAKSEWMTTEFVPFEAKISFVDSGLKGNNAMLVLKKDNPSGLPEHDDQFFIPVVIKNGAPSQSPCIITGCSGQICSDQETITTCEFMPIYACYKNARCEQQTNGKCGWTETPAFQTCRGDIKNQ